MKMLKKLPFLLAFVVTLFAASCSDISVEPVGIDDDDEPIIIRTPPNGIVAPDTVTIG